MFHTLDAMRGIAAIGVVAFHMQRAFLPFATPGGYLAVDLFFMMSGVVLSLAYESRFVAGMGTLEFMRVRLVRLYPLYLLGTALAIGVTLASLLGRNSQNWDPASLALAALLALLFLPNPTSRPVDQIFPLNIPCWSLFFELLVNLLFVVTWPWLTTRRLAVASALSGAVTVFAAVQQGHLDQGSTMATLSIGLARTMFGFAVGVLIARHVARSERPQSNLGVLAIAAIVAVAIAGRPTAGLRPVWDIACVLVVFPVLVSLGTWVEPGPRLRKVASFLGITSYAIYVLHSPLSSVVNSLNRHGTSGGDEMLFRAPYLGFGVLAGLLVFCWLIDRYFDLPIRRSLSRRFARARTPSTQS